MVRNLTNNTATNKDYLESGRWKCDKSPGGAHYWIVSQDHMTCRHCAENRKVVFYTQNPVSFDIAKKV